MFHVYSAQTRCFHWYFKRKSGLRLLFLCTRGNSTCTNQGSDLARPSTRSLVPSPQQTHTAQVLGLELSSQDLSRPVLLCEEILGFLFGIALPDPSCDVPFCYVMTMHCSDL